MVSSFYKWLREQDGREDSIGELARKTKKDRLNSYCYVPATSSYAGTWQKYLVRTRGECGLSPSAVDDAFLEFDKVKQESNKHRYCERWTEKENDIIRENYKYKDRLITLLPGRTWTAIKIQTLKLGLRVMGSHSSWTNDEDEILRREYPNTNLDNLILLMPHRTKPSIQARCYRLGVKMSVTAEEGAFFLDKRRVKAGQEEKRSEHVSALVTPSLLDALKRRAGNENTTQSFVVFLAIKEYLE